ncbi:trypsin-like peptidase domain-containing protein [Promicromonospora panici]|uniref:trypsin-like peptidase domain-containing protein n=1 Tax=Promicromonospora panici TaxID=2219658 RepID=UPI00101DCC8C|nr:trypsin-like peptidase domain-containing protein [Promicromonospora panici]
MDEQPSAEIAPKPVAPFGAALLATALLLTTAACTGDSPATGAEASAETSTSPQPARGDDLLSRLQEGGFTIVVRHAATDQSRPDEPTVNLDDCATQRNLSGAGRSDARSIGTAVQQLDIPIGAVWASPYCRSRDTAELAFGRFDVVDGLERLYPERDEEADRQLNQRIQQESPRAGEPNLIIAGHGVYPSVLSPPVAIGEGEAALYARSGDGFTLVDRLEPGDWAELGTGASGPNALGEGAAQVPDSVVGLAGPRGGSAFRVAVPGILVTSAQLVAGFDEVTVIQPDGGRPTAQVLGREESVDIAALRVDDDSGLPPLHSASGLAEASIGDRVFAVGAEGEVTSGSLQAPDQSATGAGGDRLDVLGIDAVVPTTSLGGPLVNEDGAVLGVLTATTGTTTGSVAVPVDVARDAALGIVRGS